MTTTEPRLLGELNILAWADRERGTVVVANVYVYAGEGPEKVTAEIVDSRVIEGHHDPDAMRAAITIAAGGNNFVDLTRVGETG